MAAMSSSPRRNAVLAVFATAGLFACVPQAQYDSTLKDLDSAKGSLADVQSKLDACEAKLASQDDAPPSDDSDAEALREELDSLRAANAKRQAAFEELQGKLKSLIEAGELEVYVRRGRMIIGLPSGVLFGSGKAELSKKGKKTVGQVAKVLQSLEGRRIEIAGHTDNVPIGKSTYVDNWELSAVRALTVTRFLVEGGVDPANLSAAGYGEHDPVGNNKNRSGRKKNRRIELILVPDLSALPGLVDSSK